MIQKINISETFDLITEHFRPKTVTELNGQAFQLAKIKGAQCPQTVRGTGCNAAPTSLAMSGRARVAWVDSANVGEGECITVPKGTRQRPRVSQECWIFLIEPVGTKNNGDTDVDAKYDAPAGAWV